MNAEEIFKQYYGELVNVATPIVVEYGWVLPPVSAYELSTNRGRTLYGITVVALIDGEIVEQQDGRWAGFAEGDAREHVEMLRKCTHA